MKTFKKNTVSYVLLFSLPYYFGCTSTTILTQDEFSQSKEQHEIILVKKDGTEYRFREKRYRVQGDSLVCQGVQLNPYGKDLPFRGTIPLTEVEYVRVKEENAGLTALIVVGVLLSVAIVSIGSSAKSSLH